MICNLVFKNAMPNRYLASMLVLLKATNYYIMNSFKVEHLTTKFVNPRKLDWSKLTHSHHFLHVFY